MGKHDEFHRNKLICETNKKSAFLCYTTQHQVSFLRGEYRLVRGRTFCALRNTVLALKVRENRIFVLCLHIW